MVEIIEEYISSNPYDNSTVLEKEFRFKQSVRTDFPVVYQARDLREFTEDLRKISPCSLYFHVFESRLRLNPGIVDFSRWLKEEMGEDELSLEVSTIDLHKPTLEEIRSSLIRVIEKHIK
jgi:hypothetical protein